MLESYPLFVKLGTFQNSRFNHTQILDLNPVLPPLKNILEKDQKFSYTINITRLTLQSFTKLTYQKIIEIRSMFGCVEYHPNNLYL